MRYNSGAAKAPHLIISDEQIEGIVRFYAASATCQGDKLKWTPTCQGTNCGARMFPGFLLNLSLFLSSAGGQLGVGPLSPGCAVPAPPKGEPSLASPFGGRWCPVGTVQRLVSAAASVGDGRSPLGCITRAGRRECPRRGRRGLREATFLVRYRPGKTLRCFPSFSLAAAQ